MKKKFCEFLVKYRWLFVAVFAVLTVGCIVMMFFTEVNYDLSGSLPHDSGAYIGMEVLKGEFDDKGMTYVVIEDIEQEEANDFAEELSSVEGVANVVYVEMQNYVDGNAIYTVSFDYYDSTEECFDSIERVMKFVEDSGYDGYYTGQSASSFYTKFTTESSIVKIGVVIVVIILAMLIFTGKSYFELVPLVISFGVAVALNMGTNFFFNFFGGISYVSNLVSLVLQLALSIDYSVILLHRFMEEHATIPDTKEAVKSAMSKGISEICSSSLTTIAGLLTLTLMALPIGREIGITLAKSIVFSLVSVIFLMPSLLIIFSKPLIKTMHKSFVPSTKKMHYNVLGARKVIVPLFLVVVLLAGGSQYFYKYNYNMNSCQDILENNENIEELGFGKINSLVVVVPKGNYEKERELARYIASYDVVDGNNALSNIEIADGIYLTDEFTKEEFVDMITSGAGTGTDLSMFEGIAEDCYDSAVADSDKDKLALLDILIYVSGSEEYKPLIDLTGYGDMLDQLVYAKGNLEGENYARMTFNITSGVESEKTFNFIKDVREKIGEYYEEYYVTGESVVCCDFAEHFPQDNLIVSVVTIAAILVILLFTFRNILLPLILILAIQGGIWLNFSITLISGNPISFIGYLIICAVQMGATIDYAIVLTSRYTSMANLGMDKRERMAIAVEKVFPTVITSGTILTLTGGSLSILSSGIVASLGSLLAIGTTFSMLIVIFILPSMLTITEKLYEKCYFKNIFKKKKKNLSVAEDTDN